MLDFAEEVVGLHGLVAGVTGQQQVVARLHAPREPHEKQRVNAQRWTTTHERTNAQMHERTNEERSDGGVSNGWKSDGQISPKCVPEVIGPDTFSGGLLRSARP